MKSAANTSRNWLHSSKRSRAEYSNPDPVLWLTVFALVAIGLVMVYSSSFIYAQEKFKDGLYFFKRHLIFSGIGVGLFLVGWKLSLAKLKQASVFVLAGVIGLLVLTLIPGIGHKVGGATRWINLGGFTFQPAEFAKLAVILFISFQISRKINQKDKFTSGFLTYFVAIFPVLILLMFQPDFGSTAICVLMIFTMLFACGVRLRYFITAIFIAVPSMMYLILSSPYRKNRILGFLDPWSDPANKGFQVIQSWLAFFSGKWFGVGLGNSREKLFYLPEAHNDFIFAVIGEELGFLGVLFIVVLFTLIIFRGLHAIQANKDPYKKALASGITALIGFQAFFNMAVVLGLLPTKGLPLPLISYGGTALITVMFLLGLLTQLSERPD